MHGTSAEVGPSANPAFRSATIQLVQGLSNPRSIATALLALGLVAGFTRVAQHAVVQGDATRQATALVEEAHWRCGAVRPMNLRQACVDRVRAARPTTSQELQALVSGAAGALPMSESGPETGIAPSP